MERLTDISLNSELPAPKKLIKSEYEEACSDVCERYCSKGCVGCPLQECITELHNYQLSDLEPAEIEQLKKDKDYWHREALKWAGKLGEEKIRYRKLLNSFGVPESIDIDERFEKQLQAFIET